MLRQRDPDGVPSQPELHPQMGTRGAVSGEETPLQSCSHVSKSQGKEVSVYMPGRGRSSERLSQRMTFFTHNGTCMSRATESCDGSFLTLQAQRKHLVNVDSHAPPHRQWPHVSADFINNSPESQHKGSAERTQEKADTHVSGGPAVTAYVFFCTFTPALTLRT